MSTIPQCTIYIIQNMISGGVYVGQTIANPALRRQAHFYALRRKEHRNSRLQRSWNKYGAQAFEFCVIEECATIEATNEAEIFYIQYFRSLGIDLYNYTAGGRNARHSAETIAKQRSTWLGRKHSPESIEKMRAANTGRKHSEETKSKHRGVKRSAESRAKQSISNTGIKRSAATKAKMSAWQVGSTQSAEFVAQRTAAASVRYNKGYIFRSPNGTLVRAPTIRGFVREYGLDQGNVTAMVHGRANICKGWTFVGFEDELCQLS